MLSIIICSRTPTLNPTLIQNIKNTIGCEYEWVVIDNAENQYSIFEAYNLGIERSKGSLLCFVHDDILFDTKNWGLILFERFNQNPKLGLLGAAGAKSKTKMPSGWWDCPDQDAVLYLKQHRKNASIDLREKGFEKNRIQKVVVIDGFFMVARKDKRFRFQEAIKGFHGYDLNISFEYIKLGYEINVSNLILIEHFSLGTLDKNWYRTSIQVHKLYSNMLPLEIGSKTKKYEFLNGVKFIKGLMGFKLKREAFSFWLKVLLLKPISRFHLRFLKEILN
jgi:hypothetical protein